jgi:hypothetical protein
MVEDDSDNRGEDGKGRGPEVVFVVITHAIEGAAGMGGVQGARRRLEAAKRRKVESAIRYVTP